MKKVITFHRKMSTYWTSPCSSVAKGFSSKSPQKIKGLGGPFLITEKGLLRD